MRPPKPGTPKLSPNHSLSNATAAGRHAESTNDTDPSSWRVQQVSATGFQVKVEEEKSKFKDIMYIVETVGYLGFDKIGE